MEAIRRLRRLLTTQERKKVGQLLGLATFAALVQSLAVFSVMPFMELVAKGGSNIDYPMVEWLRTAFQLDQRDLMLAMGLAVLILVLTANVLGALSLRQMALTAWNINHFLSQRLLAAYLHRPYAWFLTKHSSGLSRNLLQEARQVVIGAVIPLLTAGTCQRQWDTLRD